MTLSYMILSHTPSLCSKSRKEKKRKEKINNDLAILPSHNRKYKGVEKFIAKIKEIQGEAKAALGKVQEEMRKYTDKKREEVDKYKVGNLVMLSTKDLKYQMIRRRIEKLTKRFVGPYKIKKIVSMNIVELKLPSIIRIYPVVNVSRICRYVGQVKGQRREQPAPVIIEGEKKWEVEKILNKQRIQEKDKYLV